MANWCRHWVEFSGEKDAVEKILNVFREMEKEQMGLANFGLKPDFLNGIEQDFFYDIQVDDENKVVVYDTKWAPNMLDLEAIAVHCGVNFIADYEELGSSVFGKSILTDAGIVEYDLEGEDFEKYTEDEEYGFYVLDGEDYECETDVLEKLFENRVGFSY